MLLYLHISSSVHANSSGNLFPLNAESWGQETTDLQGEEVGHSDSKIKVPIPALQFIRCLGRMPIVLKLCLNIVHSLKEC